ncbi:hypothetical protein [Dermatobacter hominis]|uniref:hypothetical protein n=1 Tax=Dermatobacter hominis TaxID=2884263 RepID=UPI001D117363|nr:hypothetical protein [Dermatobacter hominis]UDY37175.1 hypothetical protein LH044_06450 [Dermatobacter hominis]
MSPADDTTAPEPVGASGATGPGADGWDAALDRFEECIATGEPFEPPTDLGALPPRVAVRARALLAACDARRRELTAERDRVVADLRSTQRRHRAGASAARDRRDPGILV